MSSYQGRPKCDGECVGPAAASEPFAGGRGFTGCDSSQSGPKPAKKSRTGGGAGAVPSARLDHTPQIPGATQNCAQGAGHFQRSSVSQAVLRVVARQRRCVENGHRGIVGEIAHPTAVSLQVLAVVPEAQLHDVAFAPGGVSASAGSSQVAFSRLSFFCLLSE